MRSTIPPPVAAISLLPVRLGSTPATARSIGGRRGPVVVNVHPAVLYDTALRARDGTRIRSAPPASPSPECMHSHADPTDDGKPLGRRRADVHPPPHGPRAGARPGCVGGGAPGRRHRHGAAGGPGGDDP